jgi:phosphoribosylamine--glycine ligase
LAQSQLTNQLFIAPGNGGTKDLATNINIGVNDFEAIKKTVLENQIKLVIVGPEDPLVNGLHDFFLSDQALRAIPVIGPQKLGATLEGSKEFAKAFMIRHDIPTAQYGSFTAENIDKGYVFLDQMKSPYVLKADGLAAGKGVLIIDDLKRAKTELANMLLNKKFGVASSKVVIEEFLKGIELSCFVLFDGKSYITLPSAKDYKRIGEGDTGLNTGGMGSISPVPFADREFLKKIDIKIIKPTIQGIIKDKLDYVGFIFIGIIKVENEPFVIEYNVRMGDPETQVVLPRIKNDFLELMVKTANGKLDSVKLEIEMMSYANVVAVSNGYPEQYEKGKIISGLEIKNDSIIFHAGTKNKSENIVTNGGRVLSVVSRADSFDLALKKSYQNIKTIKFEGKKYRKDLGFDL